MEIDIESLVLKWRAVRQNENSERLDRSKRTSENLLTRAEILDKHHEEKYRKRLTQISDSFQNYKPTKLDYWFRFDTWTVEEALILLCGFDSLTTDRETIQHLPNSIELVREKRYSAIRLDGINLNDPVLSDLLGDNEILKMCWNLKSNHQFVSKLWESGSHDESRYEPKYYIHWALSKDLDIAWLKWAKEKKFFSEAELETPGGARSVEVYPWGCHSTKLMKLLSNAAVQFWSLYDPTDPSSAPTNQQVENWLIGQGVSRRSAEVMATILRADNLPAGRRK